MRAFTVQRFVHVGVQRYAAIEKEASDFGTKVFVT